MSVQAISAPAQAARRRTRLRLEHWVMGGAILCLIILVVLPWGTASARATASRVSIRPENIHLAAAGNGTRATISERTFLGNISEDYANLDSGPTLRVQTHPAQVFTVDDKVSIEIDAAQCSVFRSNP